MRSLAFAALVVVSLFIGLFVLAVVSEPERVPVSGTGIDLADPERTYDPVVAGETLPPGFRQLLPRDGILPIYEPQFVSAADAGWPEDALIIGLEIDGDARAYPAGYLNRREMVIDSVNGIPVLVTW